MSATTAAVGMVAAPAYAQSSYYYAGRAISGAQIAVDLTSIRSSDGVNARFDYWFDDELVVSEAHCADNNGVWTTLNDGIVHYAQSQATQDMVRIVCSYFLPAVETADASPVIESMTESVAASIAESVAESVIMTALVYDPVSNVRQAPNGSILCSIDTRAYINIYGSVGDWYDTDACGSRGVIHISQIQF